MSEVEAGWGKDTGWVDCGSKDSSPPADVEAADGGPDVDEPAVAAPLLYSWYSRFLSFSSRVFMRLSTNSIFGGPSLSDSATEDGWAGEGLMVWEREGKGVSAEARWRGGRDESELGWGGAEEPPMSSVKLVSPVDMSDSDICSDDCFCTWKCCCFCGVSHPPLVSCLGSTCWSFACDCVCCCASSAGTCA